MDSAFCLGRSVLVGKTHKPALALIAVVKPLVLVPLTFELEVDEANRSILRNRDRILCITNRRVSLGVKRMVRNLVLCDVVKCILKCPVGNRVAFSKAASDGSILKEIDPRTFCSLPACSAIDHAVSFESLEPTLEGLNLTDTIILVNVLLPQVRSVLGVVRGLVSDRDTLCAENFRFEIIVLFDLLQELHRLWEEMESVNDHNLALAILEVPHSV
mmetsp:Transcript_27805/g.64401  ORF Transcript_27805/g.64401 Transcript_27805/m.64401 type:complete len:216 (-) Transcript_27805:309-956(-)